LNWKPIKGYLGYYEVHKSGKVRSIPRTIYNQNGARRVKGKILHPEVNNRGYKRVKLYKHGASKRMFVHRLVAVAHLLNPFKMTQVGRKNGNKLDNRSTNLKWKNRALNQGRSQHVIMRPANVFKMNVNRQAPNWKTTG